MDSIDFFIAHAGPDKNKAQSLGQHLRSQGATVFLDSDDLKAGSAWQDELKDALMAARITVVLISVHSDESFYQQEEIAIAINLFRSNSKAHHVVPVFLVGSHPEHTPYGLTRLNALFEDKLQMDGVARELLSLLNNLPKRPAVESLGHAVSLLDRFWETAEGLYDEHPIPRQHRAKFEIRDGSMVQLSHGDEWKRITRDEFDQKLTSEQLEEVFTREKAMEVNLAVWDEAHPQRVLDPVQRQLDKDAVTAMAEDLAGVLRLVRRAGFELDDHYDRIRGIVEPLARQDN